MLCLVLRLAKGGTPTESLVAKCCRFGLLTSVSESLMSVLGSNKDRDRAGWGNEFVD